MCSIIVARSELGSDLDCSVINSRSELGSDLDWYELKVTRVEAIFIISVDFAEKSKK